MLPFVLFKQLSRQIQTTDFARILNRIVEVDGKHATTGPSLSLIWSIFLYLLAPFLSLSLFQCLAVYVLYRLSMEKKMKARLSPIVIFLVILLFELSLSFCNFINSTAYSTWADASLHLFLHKSCMVYLSLSLCLLSHSVRSNLKPSQSVMGSISICQ